MMNPWELVLIAFAVFFVLLFVGGVIGFFIYNRHPDFYQKLFALRAKAKADVKAIQTQLKKDEAALVKAAKVAKLSTPVAAASAPAAPATPAAPTT